jgi:DNA polymerase-3 subunit epsilon
MSLRPIYYDTETTGIRSDKDRVIEIAAYDPFNDRSFVKLINPGMPIPLEATAIHHITNDMVAEAPGFADIIPEFSQFCEGESVLIAHNNDAFDVLFLRNEFDRSGVKMPDWRFLDTLKWARKYRPDLPRHSLQFLRESYGFPANNAHRALDDVIVLHQVFSMMIDDLPMETVFELLKTSAKLTTMPFGKYQGKALDQVPKDYVQWLAKSGALDKNENQQLKAAFEKIGFLSTVPV